MADSETIKKTVMQSASKAAKAAVMAMTESNDESGRTTIGARQATVVENTRAGRPSWGSLGFIWIAKDKHIEMKHFKNGGNIYISC